MNKKLETFYYKLSKRQNSSTVFNPYLDKKLLTNLKHYLDYILSSKEAAPLLIGEAPGYKGCRITGIPFTSSELIHSSKHDVFVELKSKLSFEEVSSENTASIIWANIDKKGPYPLFWNAFPFHPHRSNNPKSNRAPSNIELNEGKEYLDLLIEVVQPKQILAIGRSAEHSLKTYYPDMSSVYIRHPSYGGKRDFIEGIKRSELRGWAFKN